MCLLCVHSAVGCDPSALWYTMPNAENAMIHTFGTHSRSLLWWPCMARFSCVFLLLVWMRHGHYHFAARLPSTCTIAQNPTLTLTKCVSHGNIFFFLFILLCLVPLRCFDRASYGAIEQLIHRFPLLHLCGKHNLTRCVVDFYFIFFFSRSVVSINSF